MTSLNKLLYSIYLCAFRHLFICYCLFSVNYNSMSPTKAVFDREGSSELLVTFSGGKVPNLPLICIISGDGKLKTLKTIFILY